MESTIGDVLKSVDRFRILCVGNSGVGKSSLIQRVFGLQEAPVAHWNVGSANIEIELTSEENKFFVLHDSMGFEPGNADTFNIVHEFITQRRDKSRPLKDQLHALWLCTEAPVAGARVFETGDERLLQVAQQTETPVVVVFTKYDKLVRTKMAELKEDNVGLNPDDLDKRAKEEARKTLDTIVQSLHNAIRKLDSTMETPRWAKVSIYEGYEIDISSLVEITCDVVQKKLRAKSDVDTWVMWAIVQRASLQPKIEACSAASAAYYRRSLAASAQGDAPLLRDCLAEAHKDINTCWNFKDETDETILSGDNFKKLMLYLVQDVQESLNHGGSSYTRSSAIDEIFRFLSQITTKSTAPPPDLPGWLKRTVWQSEPQIQLLLMAYTVDLTTVLKLLFETMVTPAQMPQSSGRVTWSELKKAFDVYKDEVPLERIHRRLCDIFQHDQQILGSEVSFRRQFDELLKDERQVSTPASSAPPKPAPGPASNPERVTVPRTVLVPINPSPTPQSDEPGDAPQPSWCRRICPRCFSP